MIKNKLNIFVFLLSLFLISIFSISQVVAISNNGLLAYYSFEENNKVVLIDSLGIHNLNNISSINNIQNTTGKIGNAYRWNGSSLSNGYNGTISNITDKYSVNFWVKTLTYTNNEDYFSLNKNSTYHYDLAPRTTTIKYHLSNNSFSLLPILTSSSINGSNWNMITLTHDSLNNRVKLYVNGTLQQTNNSYHYLDSLFNNIKVMQIGSNNESIDELSIWNRILSQNEITELYGNGSAVSYNNISVYSFEIPMYMIDVNSTYYTSINTTKFLGSGEYDLYKQYNTLNYTTINDGETNVNTYTFNLLYDYYYSSSCNFEVKSIYNANNNLLYDSNYNVFHNITDYIIKYNFDNQSNNNDVFIFFMNDSNKVIGELYLNYNISGFGTIKSGVYNSSGDLVGFNNILSFYTLDNLGLRYVFKNGYYVYQLFLTDNTLNHIPYYTSNPIIIAKEPQRLLFGVVDGSLTVQEYSYYNSQYPYLNETYSANYNLNNYKLSSCTYNNNTNSSIGNDYNFCTFISNNVYPQYMNCNKITSSTYENGVLDGKAIFEGITGFNFDNFVNQYRIWFIILILGLVISFMLVLNNSFKERHTEIENQTLYVIIFGVILGIVIIWLLGIFDIVWKILLIIALAFIVFMFIKKLFFSD